MKNKSIMKYRALILAGSFSRSPERGIAYLKSAGIEGIVIPPEEPDRDKKILALLPEIHALFISGGRLCSKEIILAGRNLRVISICGSGYDEADLAGAASAGIVVVNSPIPGLIEAVADLTFGFILALARHIPQQNMIVKQKRFEPSMGVQVWGNTIGIVGLGRIGKAVAKRARGFSMRILAFEKAKDEDFAKTCGVEYVSLNELLCNSKFISLHLNLSEETKCVIGRKELNYIKPGAFLINTARGGLIDHEALYNALQEKRLAGAGIDDLTASGSLRDKLLALDNVICTPHIGNRTFEGVYEVIDLAVSQGIDVLEGRRPEFVLNPEVYERCQ